VPEDALAAFQASPNNLNIEAAYVHILGDIILSVGVIVAASIIYFLTEKGGPWNYYHLADPLCTYLFSVLVVMTTFRITKKSIVILLDGCLD
jgi:zinc transporter 2